MEGLENLTIPYGLWCLCTATLFYLHGRFPKSLRHTNEQSDEYLRIRPLCTFVHRERVHVVNVEVGDG